jgi:hypothetical protein
VNKYFPFVTTPIVFGMGECHAPAIVYWMPEASRGALRAELPVAKAVIEQVAFTEPNWDGYGALPISVETKDNALNALQNLLRVAPTPDISPNPNGTLSFEWESGEGKAHMEIGRTQYSFYVSPRVGTPVLFEGLADDVSRLHGTMVASFLFPPAIAAGTTTNIRFASNVRYPD